MAGNASDLRVGAVVNLNGELFKITKYEHVTPGKGHAHHQVKMKNIKTGRSSEKRFRTGETIEFIRVESRNYQYLYRDGHSFIFMNMDTYEQIPVDDVIVGNSVDYMKENQDVQLAFVDEEVISIELPSAVNLKIIQTDPGLRGDTATNVLKPATVETGATIQVPLFINESDTVRVDSTSGNYIERVNV